MSKAIVSVACKARDLTDTLSESIRADIHAKLDALIAAYQEPIPYALTEAGLRERLADDVEPRLSSEYDTREP